MMEAIVLAGGFGTRLRSVVHDTPKPMAPVAGRPFLEILLASLARKGFCRVVLSIGYLAEKVVQHFGGRFADMELVYEIETTPRGTGGAVREALKQCVADHVFILNGDTYLDMEAEQIEHCWQKNRHPILVAREVPDASRYGRLETADSQLMGFTPKGCQGPGLINGGCYVFPKQIIDENQYQGAFSLEADWFPQVVAQKRFDVFISRGLFVDIGVPEDYRRAQELLAGVSD